MQFERRPSQRFARRQSHILRERHKTVPQDSSAATATTVSSETAATSSENERASTTVSAPGIAANGDISETAANKNASATIHNVDSPKKLKTSKNEDRIRHSSGVTSTTALLLNTSTASSGI